MFDCIVVEKTPNKGTTTLLTFKNYDSTYLNILFFRYYL